MACKRIVFRAILIPLGLLLMRCAAVHADFTGSPTAESTTDETQLEEYAFEEVPSTHVPNLTSTPMAVEATAGEAVHFPCEVDDLGGFVLLWKRENHKILFAGDLRVVKDNRVYVEGTSLHISSVQPKDSGEYTCQVTTTPPVELTHMLDVQYPPSVRPRPKEGFVTAKEGKSVTLMCDANGNPPPTITWKHAGRNYNSAEDGSYVINNAQKEDSGEYECIADNSVGDPATAVITVEIVSAPKVFPEPKDGLLVVKEGETITIGCKATGDPIPVITWRKPNGERLMKMNDNNGIVIPESTREDAGTYECIANNSMGISASALIRVQVLYPPKLRVSHMRIYAREESNISLTCNVEGEPSPTVTWKKDNSQINQSTDHHMKNHGHSHMLHIHHLKKDDFGQYECTASNPLSVASATISLIGTPPVPSFTSKPHSTQGTKYTISWTVNSHTPIDEYSLMYRKRSDEEEWEIKTIPANQMSDESMLTQMYQLIELQPATEYEAVIKARNKFGWSEQSEALVFTTKSEEKHMENLSSSSSSLAFSLTSLLIIICSTYCH